MPAKKKSRVSSRGNAQLSKSRGAATKSSHAASSHEELIRADLTRRAAARSKDGLWVANKTSLTRPDDDGLTSWSLGSKTPRDARLLELADVALGLRSPESFRKRKSLVLGGHHAKQP